MFYEFRKWPVGTVFKGPPRWAFKLEQGEIKNGLKEHEITIDTDFECAR